jgi:hypothetical protein
MQPIFQNPMLIPVAANDLPASETHERARHRDRECRLRGPTWAEPPARDQRTA